jgi:bis(5'-adenosyl)-triphosphatase
MPVQQNSCPFCDTSAQASVFFTHGKFLALYNIAPVLPGHSLVIPKDHISSLMDLSDTELFEFMVTARMTLQILMKAFHTDSFDWSVQEKPEAGQTIEHLHLHIVPRLKGDLTHPGEWYPLIQHNDPEIIDSFNRHRLNKEHMTRIIAELRQVAANLHK